jgi:molecular chaperone DnaK (HSP70)
MIAGIDVGTSNSSICILNKEGKAEPIRVDTGMSVFGGEYLLPSAVFFNESNCYVGQAAYNSRMSKPENFKSEFKREFGQKTPFSLDGIQVFPEDLFKEVFVHLKKCAEDAVCEPIEHAYITHPASYSEPQKELLTSVAQKAGFLHCKLIQEPVAAAMNYIIENSIDKEQIILVYDFGGGTFDASLLRFKENKFDLLANPVGIERCGGIDLDNEIFKKIKENIPQGLLDRISANPQLHYNLMSHINEISIKAKHHLSEADSFNENIIVGLDMINFTIQRQEFNQLINNYIDETINSISELIKNAGINREKINTVVLVGGTSRIPYVREKLITFFGNKVTLARTPELAIAKGASLYRLLNPMNGQNNYHYCPSCSNVVLSNNSFCNHCGSIITTPDFIKDEKMKEQYHKSLVEFINGLNKNPIKTEDQLMRLFHVMQNQLIIL